MASTSYVLLVEDNPGDARLTQTLLADEGVGPALDLRWVQSVDAAVHMLETEPGCEAVLLDLGLPDAQGLATLQAIRHYASECAIVVLTGDEDEAVGLRAVVDGAQDYLVKGSFDAGLLRRCLRFAVHRKRAERALFERALHDELTGLPRRALLMDRLQEALKHFQRDRTAGALMFIDLDRFKEVNDIHGHAAGDAVLCAVADRLRATVRGSDTAARLGGDEFVVLLPRLASAEDALAVARKVAAAVAQPVEFAGRWLSVSASIGVAQFGDAELDAQQLMSRADAAMYSAKASGRGNVRLLSPSTLVRR
jgi:two-component system cell cycle response regulator